MATHYYIHEYRKRSQLKEALGYIGYGALLVFVGICFYVLKWFIKVI